ncbi:MAG: hypothetical protein C0592_14005 [Marinilabiliales bacterium]|nr:MAG: hypothetical protein C0592_14005 [Marinilabiliales bacterium]
MKLSRKVKLLVGLIVLAAFGSSVHTSCRPTRTCYKTMPVDEPDTTVMKQKPVQKTDLALEKNQNSSK